MEISFEQFKSQCFLDSLENLEFLLGHFKHDLEYLESVNKQFKGHWDSEISIIKNKIDIISSIISIKKHQFESVKIIIPKQINKYALIVTDILEKTTKYYSNNKLCQTLTDECEYFVELDDAEKTANQIKKQYYNCLISIIKVTIKQEIIKSIM